MTDYSITVSNSVLFVGYNPTETWGSLTWGTDNWRFLGETIQDVDKVAELGPLTFSPAYTEKDVDKVAELGPLSMVDAPIKDIEHLNDMGSTLLSDSTIKAVTRGISDSFTMDYEITNLYLTDANGYNYVFIGGVIDADDRSGATWTAQGGNSATWSPVTGASAVWS